MSSQEDLIRGLFSLSPLVFLSTSPTLFGEAFILQALKFLPSAVAFVERGSLRLQHPRITSILSSSYVCSVCMRKSIDLSFGDCEVCGGDLVGVDGPLPQNSAAAASVSSAAVLVIMGFPI